MHADYQKACDALVKAAQQIKKYHENHDQPWPPKDSSRNLILSILHEETDLDLEDLLEIIGTEKL